MANNFIQQFGRTVLSRAGTVAAKAVRFNDYDRGGLYGSSFRRLISGTSWDYQASAGKFYENSAALACINYMATTFSEAPPIIQKRDDDGSWLPDYSNSMLEVLNAPNPYFDWELLSQAIVTDLYLDGNTYLIKERNLVGQVIRLWWAPHWMIEPVYENGQWISYYEYNPDGIRNNESQRKPVRYEVSEIVHLQLGYDPVNPRKGRTPLLSVLREVATDNEAAIFAASVVRNMGIPGVVIAPEGEDVMLDADDRKTLKDLYREETTGDNRGGAIVLSMPVKLMNPGFSPDKLALEIIRRVPEERIAAVMQLPAVTVGLGAGLQAASAKASHSESREAAYEGAIMPLQKRLAAQFTRQLLVDFGKPGITSGKQRMWYDYSDVRVLQKDLDNLYERWGKLFERGGCKRSMLLKALNLPFDSSDELTVHEIPLRKQVITTGDGEAIEGEVVPDKKTGQKALRAMIARQLMAGSEDE
jgi:HK97 family phage portal protein